VTPASKAPGSRHPARTAAASARPERLGMWCRWETRTETGGSLAGSGAGRKSRARRPSARGLAPRRSAPNLAA
jgi:hypothetical protein